MFERIWNLFWKEGRQILRHRLLLVFVLAFPIWNLTSVADMVSRGIMHIPTAVYDQSQSRDSRELTTMLINSEVFEIDHHVASQADLQGLLDHGTVKVGLIIPPDFATEVVKQQATVQVLLDGSETTTALIAQAYLEGMAYVYTRQLLTGQSGGPSLQLATVDTRARTWFNEEMRREIFQLPGEMAGGLAMLAVLLPALAIIREREDGTLEQLMVTPLRPFELVIGKSLLTLLIAYAVFWGMLALNVLHFGVPLRGSVVLLGGITVFYIFVEMGWGLLISATARTQGQGFLGAFIVVILEVIFSGQILPVDQMPPVAQWLSTCMPNQHFTTIVREIMLKGANLSDLWPQIISLGIIGLVLYTLAMKRLQKKLD